MHRALARSYFSILVFSAFMIDLGPASAQEAAGEGELSHNASRSIGNDTLGAFFFRGANASFRHDAVTPMDLASNLSSSVNTNIRASVLGNYLNVFHSSANSFIRRNLADPSTRLAPPFALFNARRSILEMTLPSVSGSGATNQSLTVFDTGQRTFFTAPVIGFDTPIGVIGVTVSAKGSLKMGVSVQVSYPDRIRFDTPDRVASGNHITGKILASGDVGALGFEVFGELTVFKGTLSETRSSTRSVAGLAPIDPERAISPRMVQEPLTPLIPAHLLPALARPAVATFTLRADQALDLRTLGGRVGVRAPLLGDYTIIEWRAPLSLILSAPIERVSSYPTPF